MILSVPSHENPFVGRNEDMYHVIEILLDPQY